MTTAEPAAQPSGKIERELRLAWQSRLLLPIVLLPACAGLALLIARSPTAATAVGLAICAAFGLLVRTLRAATPPAAVAGFLLTSCLYLGTVAQPHGSWRHTALLPGLALFVLAFASTRFRRSQKEHSGLAESRRGRGAAQVVANMGVAALAALPPFLFLSSAAGTVFGLTHWGTSFWIVAAVAALAEAAADTVSSEIGQAIGGRPVLLTSGKRVAPGTDGAVSLAGTSAGAAAGAILVLIAIPTLGLDLRQAAAAWIAAIGGLFADSLIGATLERRGWLNNDAVNFVSTAIAAALALAWSGLR